MGLGKCRIYRDRNAKEKFCLYLYLSSGLGLETWVLEKICFLVTNYIPSLGLSLGSFICLDYAVFFSYLLDYSSKYWKTSPCLKGLFTLCYLLKRLLSCIDNSESFTSWIAYIFALFLSRLVGRKEDLVLRMETKCKPSIDLRSLLPYISLEYEIEK